MAYPDPYGRPLPDRFLRRWLVVAACVAALMLLWQFLPAIEAWFSPREAAERTVTARGDLAAGRIVAVGEPRGSRFGYWLVAPTPQWRQKKVQALVEALAG